MTSGAATCPMCAEDIDGTEPACPHCGSALRPAQGAPSAVRSSSAPPRARHRFVWVSLACLGGLVGLGGLLQLVIPRAADPNAAAASTTVTKTSNALPFPSSSALASLIDAPPDGTDRTAVASLPSERKRRWLAEAQAHLSSSGAALGPRASSFCTWFVLFAQGVPELTTEEVAVLASCAEVSATAHRAESAASETALLAAANAAVEEALASLQRARNELVRHGSLLTVVILGELAPSVYEVRSPDVVQHFLLRTTSTQYVTKGWATVMAHYVGEERVVLRNGLEAPRELFEEGVSSEYAGLEREVQSLEGRLAAANARRSALKPAAIAAEQRSADAAYGGAVARLVAAPPSRPRQLPPPAPTQPQREASPTSLAHEAERPSAKAYPAPLDASAQAAAISEAGAPDIGPAPIEGSVVEVFAMRAADATISAPWRWTPPGAPGQLEFFVSQHRKFVKLRAVVPGKDEPEIVAAFPFGPAPCSVLLAKRSDGRAIVRFSRAPSAGEGDEGDVIVLVLWWDEAGGFVRSKRWRGSFTQYQTGDGPEWALQSRWPDDDPARVLPPDPPAAKNVDEEFGNPFDLRP